MLASGRKSALAKMMDLELSEAQRATRDIARRFARERLERVGVEIDRTHQFPTAAIAELGGLGMLGVFIPEEYGGAGLDYVSYALVIEELSVECASTGVIVSAHASLGSWPILGTGTEAQKRQFLPKMATGEWLGCFALTEPQAGSDAAGQKTRAVRDGDSYIIRHQEFHYQRTRGRDCDRFRDDRRRQGQPRYQRVYR